MNNMHHSDFLAILGSIYKPDIYLELGLYEGETWKKMTPFCKRRIGVDIVDRKIEGEIYIENTDLFFSHFKEKIDFAFIDADHNYESSKKDFLNCYNRLNDGGIIVMHDTDPISDFLTSSGYCGDSYKIVDFLENDFQNVNVLTIPLTEAGLSIITKKQSTRLQLRKKINKN